VPRRAEAGERRSESVWILVVGAPQVVERAEGGAAVLRDHGCRVQTADLWDRIDAPPGDPPTAVLVEALDQVDAGRAALVRLRAEPTLAEAPVLVAVSVPALQRLQADDAFDDIVLVPYVPVELYVRVRRAEWRRSDFATQERVKIGNV